MNLTDLEFKVLDAIMHDEYMASNGQTPRDFEDVASGAWTNADSWARQAGVAVDQCKGVLSSLTQKGLIEQAEQGTPDAATFPTAQGFQVWQRRHAEAVRAVAAAGVIAPPFGTSRR